MLNDRSMRPCQQYGVLGLLALLSVSAIYSVSGGTDTVSEAAGSKCSQAQVRGRMATKIDYDESKSDLKSGIDAAASEGCHPVQLQLVSRHGARYPTYKDYHTKMLPFIARMKDHPLYEDYPVVYSDDQLETLSARGESQLQALGSRLTSQFPGIMGEWDSSSMKLESSFKKRAETSATSFAKGAFAVGGDLLKPHKRELTQTRNDTVLRAFDACAQRVEQTEHNADDILRSWKEGDRMLKVKQQVMARLGWDRMNTSDLLTLYKTCSYLMLTEDQFDRTHQEEPTLCSVLGETDLEALEYYFDLKKFYGFGYGAAINSQLAKPLLQLIQEEWETEEYKGSFRFGHAETTLPLMTALGLFRDNFVLRHDTPAELIASRKWNMSHMTPMAANILFVLHDCSGVRKVQLYVNEQLTEMSEVCETDKKASLCSVASFKKQFPAYTTQDWKLACDV